MIKILLHSNTKLMQEAIRSSSLKLLDDIVPLHPASAANCADQIFPIYIHMLSGGEGSSKSHFEAGAQLHRKDLRLRTMSMSSRMGILARCGTGAKGGTVGVND